MNTCTYHMGISAWARHGLIVVLAMLGMIAFGADQPTTTGTDTTKTATKTEQPKTTPTGPEGYFKQLDTNKDGKLTPEEWKQAVRFKMADTNADGVVTEEEFNAFLPK